MSVELLSAASLAAAVRQMLAAPGFAGANPHLAPADRAAITAGVWPDVPVFSPYAITHNGYSQSQ